jgi:hypothetical protein
MAKQTIISKYLSKYIAARTVANAKTLRYRVSNFPGDRAKLNVDEQAILDEALEMLKEKGE